MKTLHKTLTALAMAMLIGAGAVLLWARVNHRLPTRLRMPDRLWVAVHHAHHAGRLGALFLLVGIGWLASSSVFRRSEPYVSLDGPGGAVRVSVAAISELLARVGSDFPAVMAIRPVVAARGDALRVDLQCRVRAGTAIPTLSRALQDRVREALQRVIGINEVECVRVTVRGIVGEAPSEGAKGDFYPDFNAEPRVSGMSGRVDAEQSSDDPARR